MRLICPNCAAQYEVDAALLPAEGRVVLCSACQNKWHFVPPLQEEAPEPAPVAPPPAADAVTAESQPSHPHARPFPAETESESGPEPEAPVRPKLSDEARRIFQEEAALAAAQRRAAQTPRPTPSDDDTAAPKAPRIPTIPSTNLPDGPAGLVPLGRVTSGAPGTPTTAPRPTARRSGFALGVKLVAIPGLLALIVYLTSADLSTAVPALAPYLEQFVDLTNALRDHAAELLARVGLA
ncbi:zinc-ribbon domain-containing protein [Palleronia caenipelagi]|uniref:Zinc finger/thioredoxin putative domain-containing protein n=1 Tax=Palleronia caenipelagi TaxID=2489174 RepID=A0A547Q2U9_9RHOB|nr:zinc-ribbon domain-containing protein [Palleronia caenipelagi]TRD20716.1 hypothetical protein FEV53_09735 [Palleronia caenipelagi]